MARTVSVGTQDFEKLILNNNFYVDKTAFIKEWWENEDAVTLITRPRRFGKILNMSMLERFFSLEYQGQDEIFRNLAIGKEKAYREIQGTFPVLFLSFAGMKENNYAGMMKQFFQVITNLYSRYEFLRDCGRLGRKDKEYFDRIGNSMEPEDAAMALHQLCYYLYLYYGKK